MPSSEETYRRTPTLHVVFAVSSIVLALVTVGMLLADHLRPWKQVQRRFHDIEIAKLKASERQKQQELQAQYTDEIHKIDAEIKAANATAARNAAAIRAQEGKIDRIRGRFDELDTERKFKKAELDSVRSLYDGMIDRATSDPSEERRARSYMIETIRPAEDELLAATRRYEAVQQELQDERKALEDLKGDIAEKTKRREALTREVARVRRTLEQKEAQYGEGGIWSRLLATIRGLPILDLAAPPTKIQQISLPELTINYNFKDVPRYDRCMTCHLGIDRIGYDTDAAGKPMQAVFHAHPALTSGTTYIDPKGKTQVAGLYLDANGPHPINAFGCTICHGGQGSGTDFTFASHTPNDLAQQEQWERDHAWEKVHHWDEPMVPRRFMEASCLKCHTQVTDLSESVAPKLRSGYERITKYGCTGCHTIGGAGVNGPDLTDNRQVGPNLAHIASKADPEWTARWIRNPHAFKPDTRMPRFYDVANNSAPEDQTKIAAEVRAMTHYLYAVSTPPPDFVKEKDVPAKGDPEKGKTLFFQKGCLACHQHRPYVAADFPEILRKQVQPGVDPAQTYDPSTLPESARPFDRANFGPNLVNVAAKFKSSEQGHAWLTNWIHAPESYHAKSLMPNLQLSLDEASDLAAWLLSISAGWQVDIPVPAEASKDVDDGLNELVSLFLSKSKTYLDASEVRDADAAKLAKLYLQRTPPKVRTVLLADVDATVRAMSRDEKLMYVGQRTISRLGCFGCHNIPGFEDAKPIGTPLNGWGVKSPAKLDYGHIADYLVDHRKIDDNGIPHYDGTSELYRQEIDEETRTGFLFQKLHRPRSYDYKKTRDELKTWDDRLRMPQFAWADDPRAVEEVMTFVLGLTGEKINSKYLPHYNPAKQALAQGERLLTRYNCRGCHTLAMPQYAIAAGAKATDALPELAANVENSYGQRKNDHPEIAPVPYDPAITAFRLAEDIPHGEEVDAKTTLVLPNERPKEPIVIEGMPIASSEEEVNGQVQHRLAIQLWKPVTVRGYTFQPYDTITVNLDKVARQAPEGGDFAWLFAHTTADRSGEPFERAWNRLPPPLIREGVRVQTPWLTAFLKDPYTIRPAANLRMPRFHFGSKPEPRQEAIAGVPPAAVPLAPLVREDVEAETRDLANYFSARDNAPFPYQSIPERDRSYLSSREAEHAGYLAGGFQLVAKGLCVECHAIGQYKPTGGRDVVNGPDLNQVGDRFRPDYLLEWLAFPQRRIPYTAMPQNIPAHVDPKAPVPVYVRKDFEGKQFDQVRAIRDMLLNYTRTVEGQLVNASPFQSDDGKPPATGRGQ
jgi:cbb3-type cytochrome oxidase cytochrome c subunit